MEQKKFWAAHPAQGNARDKANVIISLKALQETLIFHIMQKISVPPILNRNKGKQMAPISGAESCGKCTLELESIYGTSKTTTDLH